MTITMTVAFFALALALNGVAVLLVHGATSVQ